MATTTTGRRVSTKRARRADRRAAARRRTLRRRLLMAGGTALALAVAAVLAARADKPTETNLGSPAPLFELASTDGTMTSLGDHRGHDVLLYFSEGVGCDACFYQQATIEAEQERFTDAGLTVVPVVVNPAADVRRELDRFGLSTPFLIDPDRSVSAAYDTIGRGHHADLPGHSFVLVDGDGTMRWRLDEPSMFVEPSRLVEGAVAALGQ
jgi:peroxiredoxin